MTLQLSVCSPFSQKALGFGLDSCREPSEESERRVALPSPNQPYSPPLSPEEIRRESREHLLRSLSAERDAQASWAWRNPA